MAKIMAVDDHQDIVDTLTMVMKKMGHKTAEANNGQQLLDRIDAEKPDLILLDVMMPGLTTKQILDKIKSKKSAAKVILVTVVRFSDDEKEALMKNGLVVDYITKPFDAPDLMERVKKQLGGKK